jgi:formylglycine-generating enzyme required for sulfatase activity
MRSGITPVFLLVLAGALSAQDRGFIQIPESQKVALVIGNSEYPAAPLKNPVNDAASMDATLRKLGFQVTLVRNADLRAMRTSIDKFAASLGPGSLGFFYFAGHGVQVNSVNYLIPVDFSASSEDDIPYEAYPASRIQAKLEGSGARLRVLVLDACRNNPYRFKRDATEGLAAMSINAEGTLVAFATGDNNTAAENPAETNGLYTKFLIPALLSPGLNLRDAFQKAKEDVYRVSMHQQNPSIYENIVGQYALIPATAPVPPTNASADAETWAGIKDSQDPRDFDNFILAFPQSPLTRDAVLRASALRRPAVNAARIEPESAPHPGDTKVNPSDVKVNPGDVKVNPGDVKVNPKDGLKYAWIPAGSFTMGCSPGDNNCQSNERPAHTVTITKGFWIGQTPVTVGGWKKYRQATAIPPLPGAGPFGEKTNEAAGNDNLPAVMVTWEEAQAYCTWEGGALPTEAQWEYAARAGNPAARYGNIAAISGINTDTGDISMDSIVTALRRAGNVVTDNDVLFRPVAQKQPNAWNLYDTLGNVWQWSGDVYLDKYYEQRLNWTDPRGPSSGQAMVIRGGGLASAPSMVRVSYRGNRRPSDRVADVGFRCTTK